MFGFTCDDVDGVEPGNPYVIFKATGMPVGGMGPGAPACWQPCFLVPNADDQSAAFALMEDRHLIGQMGASGRSASANR